MQSRLEKFFILIYDYGRKKAATVAVAFTLMAPILVGSVGLAVDMAHAYFVRERLSHALDAAALAATSSSAHGANFQTRLNNFFNANFPEGSVGIPFDLQYEIVGDDVRVWAYASYQTGFLSLLGQNEITIYAETIVRREVRGLEVALVLDVTGSMRGSKITSLRTATTSFIDIIFRQTANHEFLRVGLVPYSIAVNVGDVAPDIVDPSSLPDGVVYDPDSETDWAGCVMARGEKEWEIEHNIYDTDVYDGGYWDAYWWEHTDGKNEWDPAEGGSINLMYPPNGDNADCNNRRSPNLGCPIENPITPLTNDQDALLAAANKITHWCRGGTNGNLGMVWGWRVLSEQAPFTQGADYDDQNWRKAVVMMTDGENTFYSTDYSAYGYVEDGEMEESENFDPVEFSGYNPDPGDTITNRNRARSEANNRFIKTCQAMKDAGITVYTVTFGSGIIGTATEDYYKECASDETKYMPAASNEELIQVFENISRELSNLHIRS